jgi:hypothetical protein
MSHRPVQLQLASNATSAMVPRAPPIVAPPPVFRPDLETLARLASMPSKLLDLDACPVPPPSVGFVAQPTNRSLLGFEAQTKKSS